MDELRTDIAAKKAELDRLRSQLGGGLGNLEHTHDLELTYTSNAIEGNTLSAAETTLVIEHGITIGGKPLKDHLEALDHHDALRYVRALARRGEPLAEADLRQLHHLVVQRSQPEIAGRYADQGRQVLTDSGRHSFPSPVEVPALMGGFARWLGAAPDTPQTAFAAHRRLVGIHPFNDGNGRTARLLMNLVLIRGGYPPVAVRPQDRPDYISALQDVEAGRGSRSFERLLYERLNATLDEYLDAARQALAARARQPKAGGLVNPGPDYDHDNYDLQRFVEAQEGVIERVRAELRAGRKESHWMWFVFPQIAGLGSSPTARKFALSSLDEARDYLDHPVLGPRLRECTQLATSVEGRSAEQIFGHPDDRKFRSSMTLFAQAAADDRVFLDALQKYFPAGFDPATLARL